MATDRQQKRSQGLQDLSQLLQVYDRFSPQAQLQTQLGQAQLQGLQFGNQRERAFAGPQLDMLRTQLGSAQDQRGFEQRLQDPRMRQLEAQIAAQELETSSNMAMLPWRQQGAMAQVEGQQINNDLSRRLMPWQVESAAWQPQMMRSQVAGMNLGRQQTQEEIAGMQQARQQGAQQFPMQQQQQGAQLQNMQLQNQQMQQFLNPAGQMGQPMMPPSGDPTPLPPSNVPAMQQPGQFDDAVIAQLLQQSGNAPPPIDPAVLQQLMQDQTDQMLMWGSINSAPYIGPLINTLLGNRNPLLPNSYGR